MTCKHFINAVLTAAISFCGSAFAQQAEFSHASSQAVAPSYSAPSYSAEQLRHSLTAFLRRSEQAKQNASANVAAAVEGIGGAVSESPAFRSLPKMIPASSPVTKVSPEPAETRGLEAAPNLSPVAAVPGLPSILVLPTEETVVTEQSVAVPDSNQVRQLPNASNQLPVAALAVPEGLRVPTELLTLPYGESGTSVSAQSGTSVSAQSGTSVSAQPVESIVSQSLALPQGISVPLAESMAGETLMPILETPLEAQPLIVSEGGSANSLAPDVLALPPVERHLVLNETLSPATASAPGVYGFESPVPVNALQSQSQPQSAFVFDSANPPANPVPQNTYPVDQTPLQYAAGDPNAWQAPFTPTRGHNERNHMRPDLSLNPPPITGRPLTEYLPVQPPAFQPTDYPPKFDRDVGHRSEQPIRRFDSYSLNDGEKFDYETKKRDFPPFGEIIATGRFFYMAEALWAEPNFQGNTLIATESAGFGESIAGDFDSDFHPRFRFGFESPYGPGIELTYFNINSNSELANFASDGITSGQTSASVVGLDRLSSIVAANAGDQLVAQHSLDIDSFTVSFFKELKFPISRVNGNFGFQYVSIEQQLNANVTSGGAVSQTLRSTTDMRAFGPRAILEYYRPIGHTPLELVTTFGGSVLFGQRDQFVVSPQTGALNRVGADEFLTILDFFVGAQYTKNVGENRAWYGRGGFMNQTWLGGGSATFPQGDFGLRGFTFGIGYNR